MKVHYPKLYNMAHLSLNVFTASKESNNYILFYKIHSGTMSLDKDKYLMRHSDQDPWFTVHKIHGL